MMLQIGDDGVVSSVNEENLIYVDKKELEQFIESYQKLEKENEQLKKELKVYRKLASCSNCRYHDYDWDINDGYGGEEYEVCDKGNDVTDGICEGWEEF